MQITIILNQVKKIKMQILTKAGGEECGDERQKLSLSHFAFAIALLSG